MNKLMVLCAVVLGVTPCFAGLGDVTHIQVDNLETNGFTASYDSGVITWTGGASLSLYNGAETVLVLDNNINLSATFQQMTNQSSGDVASAVFEVVSWSILHGQQTLLSGVNIGSEVYTETEESGRTGGTGILNGDAIVQVTDGELTRGWLHDASTFDWVDSVYDGAKLKSTIIVDKSFDDYGTQTYSSVNTTMWLYADETVVPEPATLGLLGLGALLLRRRRA